MISFQSIIDKVRNKIAPKEQNSGFSPRGLMESMQESIAGGFASPINPGSNFSDNAFKNFGPDQAQAVAPTPTPTPTSAPIKANTYARQPNTHQFLEENVFPSTREGGVHDAIAAGMWAAEGRGQHRFGQAPYNNPYNINATDSNPGGAFQYENNLAGASAFADLLNRRYASALQEPGIMEQIMAIQNAGYAGDPATYDARSPNEYPSYSSFVQDTPEFRYYSNF